MVEKCCVYGCDTNYASSRKKILNRNIREVSNNNFQFIVFRKIKTKERDGYTNIMR